MRTLAAAGMSAVLALAVSGVQGDKGSTLSQAPEAAVQSPADPGVWSDTGALIEADIPEVKADPVAMESPETQKIREYAKQIANDAAVIREISEKTKKDAGLKGPGFAPPLNHEACNCECPGLDEIRRVVREELDRTRAAKPVKRADPTPVSTSSVTIFTRDNCPPCDQWKMQVMPGLIAAGWRVVEKPAAPNLSSPYFQVCTGGRCEEFTGYLSMGQLRTIVERMRVPRLFPNLRR